MYIIYGNIRIPKMWQRLTVISIILGDIVIILYFNFIKT